MSPRAKTANPAGTIPRARVANPSPAVNVRLVDQISLSAHHPLNNSLVKSVLEGTVILRVGNPSQNLAMDAIRMLP
jgi:hypothetical protein